MAARGRDVASSDGEFETDELTDVAEAILRRFRDGWEQDEFSVSASALSRGFTNDIFRGVGAASYAGIDGFRTTTWALREFFPHLATEILAVRPPGLVLAKLTFFDDTGYEQVVVGPMEVADDDTGVRVSVGDGGVRSVVAAWFATYDGDQLPRARAHLEERNRRPC